jgi:Protein of unknwon function (DUF3008)
MPSVSRSQRRLFAIAEHNPDASPEAKKLSESMSHKQLHDFAKTKEKGLPQHVKHHGRGKSPRGGT